MTYMILYILYVICDILYMILYMVLYKYISILYIYTFCFIARGLIIWLSEGAKNVYWSWVSLPRGWGSSLTMKFPVKFVYVYIYIYIYIYIFLSKMGITYMWSLKTMCNVPSQLSRKWLCDNWSTWAHEVGDVVWCTLSLFIVYKNFLLFGKVLLHM